MKKFIRRGIAVLLVVVLLLFLQNIVPVFSAEITDDPVDIIDVDVDMLDDDDADMLDVVDDNADVDENMPNHDEIIDKQDYMPPALFSSGGNVRLKEANEYFDTLSEAIAAANGSGMNIFTLEVLNDIVETSSPVIGANMNITIVGAEGRHTVTLQGGAILVQGGGNLTLGDGTVVNLLTIDSGNAATVSVTDGTAIVRDGIWLESNSTATEGGALRFHGANAGGAIEGGIIIGNRAAISVTGGARISEISGGDFWGKNNAMYLSGNGTRVDLISDGVFYQTDDTVLLHGHGIFMDHNSTIGEISGGRFLAERECGLALVRGAHVGKISGGEFVAFRNGGTDLRYWTSAIRVEGEAALTSIGTISGGEFWGENFGVLVIVFQHNSAPAEIGSITGGLFQGTRALQVDVARGDAHCRIETITGGKFVGGVNAFLNAGYVGEIGGDAEFRTVDQLGSSGAIWNNTGTIGEISGGIINSSRGNGISNAGTIELISGGRIEGSSAISNTGNPNGIITTITGGVFWGRTSMAISVASGAQFRLTLEPDLTTERIGFARFRSGNNGTGDIFNDDSRVNFPGEYFMSPVNDTLPVDGIENAEFRFLRLADPEFVTVTFIAVGCGTLSCDPTVELPFRGILEDEQIPTPIPDSGHRFIGWFLDGVEITLEDMLTLVIVEDTTFEARFADPEPESKPDPKPDPGPDPAPGSDPTPGPDPKPDTKLPPRQAYLIGTPDGLIRPSGNITRAEVATIFFRLISDETRAEYWTQINPFPDVNLLQWFNNAISTTVNMGLFEGIAIDQFAPNQSITRGELATVLVRFMGVTDEPLPSADQFSDIANHWAKDYINLAAVNGWVEGDTGLGGRFRPASQITRAEVAAMINRIFERLPETPEDLLADMITWPDNSNLGSWYYLYMQSASNSYTYEMKADDIHERWTSIISPRNWAALERPNSVPEDIFR